MSFLIAGAAKSSPMSMSVRVVRMPSPRIHRPHCRKSALCTNPRSPAAAAQNTKSSPRSTSVRVVCHIRSPHPTPSPRIQRPHCRKSALCTNPRSSSCSCAKLQHGSRSLAGAHPADGDTRNAGSRTRRPRPNSPASPTLQPPLPTCRDAQVGQTTRVRPLLRRTDKPPRASWLEAVHHFLCIPWARRAVP